MRRTQEWRRNKVPTACKLALLAALVAGPVHAAETLDNAQLDEITAGADDATLEEVVVRATHTTASGARVSVDGTVGIQRQIDTLNAADLLLRDSAQSNLQALVNLNAVQSVVNVLVNLNININSQVGELRQINLAAPTAP